MKTVYYLHNARASAKRAALDLRSELGTASPVEALRILPMIEQAAKLEQQINALIGAKESVERVSKEAFDYVADCLMHESLFPGSTYSNTEWGYPGGIQSVTTYHKLPWRPLRDLRGEVAK